MATLISLLKPIQTNRLSPESYSLSVVIHYGALVGFAGHFLFAVLFLWMGVQAMAAVNVASCFIFLVCVAINRQGYVHQALLLGASEVVTHAILAVLFIGWESGFHFYLISLVPLIFYSKVWSTPLKVALATLLGVIFIALYLYTSEASAWQAIQLPNLQLFSVVNIVTVFIVVSLLAYLYRLAATHAEESLVLVNKKLEFLANIDPLTQLLNRRNMISFISEEVVKYHRTGQPFSLIMADIDNFKNFNDSYGHAAGDAVLVNVAETLRKSLRATDWVSRWGGEEFLILLPGAELSEARRLAECLRENITAIRLQMDGIETHITMTFGISTFSGAVEVARCIHQADQAMYDGKQRGKNCVIAPIEGN